MRLLLNLNEEFPGEHANIHYALDQLKEQGVVEQYQIYPFLARLKDGLLPLQAVEEIIAIAEKIQPTAILWSHARRLAVDKEAISKLRSINAKPAIGYWDGDIYQKPLPASKEVIKLCTLSDVVFCQGRGDFTDTLKKSGCQDIRYVPATSDELRFFKVRPIEKEILYDVAMIGNNVTSLLPWRNAPGSVLRQKLVRLFHKNLQSRFVMYGSGWKSQFSNGSIPFNNQVDVYHTSRIALGTNNWLGPEYYFSNRLPIAMSSGVPVVYNYEKGFSEVFKANSGVLFYKSIEEAWDICSDLLSKSQAELNAIGMKSYTYARQYLHTNKLLLYMLDVLKEHQISGGNISVSQMVGNPWIREKQL